MKQIYFITGIDTDTGKSYATGYLAKRFMESGYSVITQKFIQTGNREISEDIELHRKIMNIGLQEVDRSRLTCPYIFSHPASPHLAAAIDNQIIDPERIKEATKELQKRYDVVLIEGAGGIMVPISKNYLTIDYIAEENLPAIIVTSSKLGSLNHTLLTLKACEQRNIQIVKVIYNRFGEKDKLISDDSCSFIKDYLKEHSPNTELMELFEISW